ncbi:hypothetical protein KUTeg_008314 [Tegillarca granosa]|uniref:Uncharacterized protein n=1 Tax=Tegillarca granosa TaxID=220873 RepID=A0ABQ9FDL8_TEGGR|nr:hypothetical protein KUTeg_008314 [Tegillarca granosa]
MALELGPNNIRVNTVSTTRVFTEKHHAKLKKEPQLEEGIKMFMDRHPLRKLADLEDVVNATLFIDRASSDAGRKTPRELISASWNE